MDTTLEDKTKELMEESRMLLVQLSIDKVSLGVHSMGNAYLYKSLCLTCNSYVFKNVCISLIQSEGHSFYCLLPL